MRRTLVLTIADFSFKLKKNHLLGISTWDNDLRTMEMSDSQRYKSANSWN